MKVDKRSSDIQQHLMEWARWRRSGHGVNVGYPSVTPFYRMSRKGHATVKAATIGDDLALSIDKAVSALKKRSEGLSDMRWDALTMSYLDGKSDSEIARDLRTSRESVKVARRAGESWVEALIDEEVM